jgi:hypothetical protein
LENPELKLLPATLNKLALCISVIALHGISSFWESAIPDLITYCLNSPTNLLYGCEIIENVISELEDSRVRLKQNMKVKSILLEYLPNIAEFITKVITADVPLNIKQKIVKIINAWISFSNSQLLNDKRIQSILIQCCQDASLYEETIQCIIKGLDHSRYSKLLENAAYTKAFKDFEECPFLLLLESVLRYLAEVIPKIEDVRVYAELLFSIGKNFSLLFLKVI